MLGPEAGPVGPDRVRSTTWAGLTLVCGRTWVLMGVGDMPLGGLGLWVPIEPGWNLKFEDIAISK